MKAVQVTMDEDLLNRLDDQEEVKRSGRSAVIREAVEEWLKRKREAAIVAAYQRGYGPSGGLDEEWSGWEDEGTWLEP